MTRVITLLLIALLLCPIALAMTSDGRGNMLVPAPRNLGISTRNVPAKLTVNGTALLRNKVTIQDGSQLAGYILLSDANGKGTWTNPASIPSNDLWTDAGTFLRPSSNSGARTVGLGGTTRNSLDLLLGANGEAVFNQQKNNSDFRIAGQTNDNLFFTDASVNRIGVANASPVALLDVGNGTANEINGIDDLIVADDLEVDDTLFAFELNGGTFYGSGAGVTNYTGAPIGPEGAIQYKDGTYMNSSIGFEWRKSSNRLGLGKTNSDSLLDINGASTIRQLLCPAGFNGDNGSSGGSPPTVPYLVAQASNGVETFVWGNYVVSDMNVRVPSANTHGDLLIAVFHYDNGRTNVTAPGWTQLIENVSPVDIYWGYKHKSTILYRIASSSEPGFYNFSFSTNVSTATGLILDYRNNDWTNPITASAANNGTHSNTTLQSPALVGSLIIENHTILRVLAALGEGFGGFYQSSSTTNGYVDVSVLNSYDGAVDIFAMNKNGMSGTITTETHSMNSNPNTHSHSAYTIAIKGIGGGGGADYPGCARENGGSSYSKLPKYLIKTQNGNSLSGSPVSSFNIRVPTITFPSPQPPTMQGDLMIALISIADKNADIISPPSGWTYLAENYKPTAAYVDSNFGITHYQRDYSKIYYKIASNSEPTNYSITLDSASEYEALVLRYNGTSTTTPISTHATNNGVASFSGTRITYPALNSFNANQHTILRLGNIGDPHGCWYHWDSLTSNGYTYRASIPDRAGCDPANNEFLPIVSIAADNGDISGTVSSESTVVNYDPVSFVTFTLAINPLGASGGGGSGNYTFPQSFTPDPNSMVLWQGIFDNNGDVGDVSAEINNGSIIKGFTIIDFDGIQNNQDPEFNGLTLNGLAANRLVITDSNKKLSTTSSVILNNNNVGISSLTPSSKLDVAALMTTTTFQIKSGAVNNYILRSDINGDSSWVAGSSVFNSAAGNDTEVQFNSAGVFAGNPNLTWASSRFNASNFSVDNGSSSAPRYTFSGSNTSGVFSFSNNHLDYTSAGVHTISLDANGNVGLRNNSPVARLDINGSLAFKSPALINLTSVSTIPNSHGFIRVQGSGAPVQLSSSPQISTGADGQLMVLKGSNNTNTLNLISKNGVTLNESTEFKMGQKDLIFLFFDADDNEWIEMGRSDN